MVRYSCVYSSVIRILHEDKDAYFSCPFNLGTVGKALGSGLKGSGTRVGHTSNLNFAGTGSSLWGSTLFCLSGIHPELYLESHKYLKSNMMADG
jgi:hypothetical protein